MANIQTEKAIIRKDKNIDELVVFYLETPANKGFITCNAITENGTVWSGSEASIEFYHSTSKATEEEIAKAEMAILNTYDIKLDVKHKLQQKYLTNIWSK